MSIIVVVKKNKKIVIAADGNYSVGSLNMKSKYLKGRSKIQKVATTYIGTVGATAHEQVLSDLFKRNRSKLSFESEAKIFQSFLYLHPILKEEYFLNTSEGGDTEEYESSQIEGLIANQHGIFGIFTWREVYEYEKFWAIGSGRNFALGSLFSTYDELDDAENIAELAVQAACEFDDGCELPITLHSMTEK